MEKYKEIYKNLVNGTRDYVVGNNLKAMILGISGGIDSTVTAAICHEVSEQTGIPLIGRSMPIKNKNDEFDVSKLVGESFCSNFKVINLQEEYQKLIEDIEKEEGVEMKNYPIACGNIQARLRMSKLYNLASIHGGLVMSTDNQTEYQLGFWTLHGDVGDFDPIHELWKTEVYELADWLKIRYTSIKSTEKAIAVGKSIELTPTDGLGISNSDLDQIGAKSYKEVDNILQTMMGKYQSSETKKGLINKYGEDVVNKVWDRHLKSEFKRKESPIFIKREDIMK